MTKKLALAFCGLILLAGCSSTKKSGMNAVNDALVREFEQQVGDRVFFAYDSSELNHHSKAQLKKQAEWLKSHPSIKATVEGHCDERGTREYNLALGERRADAVKKFLLSHGIDHDKVDTISYGKERPAAIGNNEEAWKQNRRGVTTLRP